MDDEIKRTQRLLFADCTPSRRLFACLEQEFDAAPARLSPERPAREIATRENSRSPKSEQSAAFESACSGTHQKHPWRQFCDSSSLEVVVSNESLSPSPVNNSLRGEPIRGTKQTAAVSNDISHEDGVPVLVGNLDHNLNGNGSDSSACPSLEEFGSGSSRADAREVFHEDRVAFLEDQANIGHDRSRSLDRVVLSSAFRTHDANLFGISGRHGSDISTHSWISSQPASQDSTSAGGGLFARWWWSGSETSLPATNTSLPSCSGRYSQGSHRTKSDRDSDSVRDGFPD